MRTDKQRKKKVHTLPKIRVVLADDHAVVRQGIRRILETVKDIQVVGARKGSAVDS